MDCPNPNQSAVAGLPDDLFLEILSRIALDLPRFKCVSKAWCRLIDELLHHKEHPRTLRGFFFMDEEIWADGKGSDGGLRGFLDLLPSVPLSIDPTFNFLTKLPWIKALDYVATCNGLLLFEHSNFDNVVLHYIVCNPATEQWEAVCPYPTPPSAESSTYLVFDPAVSSNFHLIQFLVVVDEDDDDDGEEDRLKREILSVHAYSSETGKWSHQDTKEEQQQLKGWSFFVIMRQLGAFVNSMLHVIVNVDDEDRLFAVDVQGKIQKIIPLPEPTEEECSTSDEERVTCRYPTATIIANSKGSLYFIDKGYDAQLSIWVLEDYEAQKWVLKDTVTYLDLFGNDGCKPSDFYLVAAHQDCSVVFLRYNKHLISYDMDRKAVRVAGTFDRNAVRVGGTFEDINPHMPVVPYVTYFGSVTNE